MKILIFGDIHGNLPALEMVFKIEKDNYDAFICHGDVVDYGPWSNECVKLLSQKKYSTLLLGNHEEYFISGIYNGNNPIATAFFEYCYPKFDKSLINIIKKYQNQTQVEDFIIKHTINNQYVYKDSDISIFEINANYIIGHSHHQFEKVINKYKIFNTGSLGQNRKYINLSCYLTLNTENKKIEYKEFKHDINKVINQMKSENYPSLCIDYYLSKKQI